MLSAVLAIGIIAAASGVLLGFAARSLRAGDDAVVARIDALLPQTQCAQCGYPGCRPYAAAIAAGDADINLCPPGGDSTIRALANLLAREPGELDPAVGVTKPARLAWIREAECIGCTLCIHACPVDAIVGTGRRMHTVLAGLCTGCELCLPPCPVDCIDLIEKPDDEAWSALRATVA